jgi:hypothetical protein
VTAQERSFSLSLAATSGVLSELANCVRNSIALEASPPTPPPPAAAATPPQIPRTLVTRDMTEFEEIKLAQNFLLAAGLPKRAFDRHRQTGCSCELYGRVAIR